MIIIFLLLLRQANTYLPLCELFHVFSDTRGWFLCDLHAPRACNLFCVNGYVCRMAEVECLVAPCYPQHHCVPIK